MENINLAKIAELAYLEIQESEKEKLAKKLEQVVEYVGKIKELDFANVSKENNTPEHQVTTIASRYTPENRDRYYRFE